MPLIIDTVIPGTLEACMSLVAEAGDAALREELPPSAMYHLDLVIEEMVSNIVRHGYPRQDSERHRIGIRIETEAQDIRVTIDDDGVPFNPLDAPVPDLDQDVADCPIGGLGIHMVREVSKDMRYEYTGGRNRLAIVLERR